LRLKAAFLVLSVLSLAAPGPAQQQATLPGQDLPPDYGGPAMLNRGGEATVVGSRLTSLTPFVSVNGIYDTGLATIATTPQGGLPFSDGYGVETTFGLTGQHPWKHSLLNLNYNGSFRHYNQSTYYDGMDNSLLFGFQHRFNRKFSFGAGENAARYSRSFFLPAAAGQPYDQTFANLTNSDLFDTPTTVYLTTARMVYEHSPRLSFSAGGNNFIVRRRSAALIGVNGYLAEGDMGYRLTRFQTVGVVYNFSHYGFQQMFGSTDIHGLALSYAVRIGRYWEFGAMAGGYRATVARQQAVAIDPAIAAILGQGSAVETFHGSVYMPNYNARLTRAFRNATVSANYSRTIVPGNGVFLASGFEGAGIGYSYRGFRRLALDLNVSYNTYSSLSQAIGKFRNYAVGGGVGYKLNRTLSVVARMDGRKYQVGGVGALNRNFYRTQLGLSWSPGEYPIPIW
jgi:hypothetical protein